MQLNIVNGKTYIDSTFNVTSDASITAVAGGRLFVPPAYYQTTADTAVQLNSADHKIAVQIVLGEEWMLHSLSVYLTALGTEGTVSFTLCSDDAGEPGTVLQDLGTMATGASADVWKFHFVSVANYFQFGRGKKYWLVMSGSASTDISASLGRVSTSEGSMVPDSMRAAKYTTDGSTWLPCTKDSLPAMWNIILNPADADGALNASTTKGHPNMTSNHLPTPWSVIANATESGYEGWRAFDGNPATYCKLIDVNKSIGLFTLVAPSDERKVFNKVIITAIDDADVDIRCFPKTIAIFMATADGTFSKVPVFEKVIGDPGAGGTVTITWENSVPCNFYIILIIDHYGVGTYAAIAEVAFVEAQTTVAPRLYYGRNHGADVYLPGSGLVPIPEDGIYVNCTALAADTLYNVYIYDIVDDYPDDYGLELSETPWVSSEGIEVKSGEPTKRFLGVAYLKAVAPDNVGPVDVADKRLVCNLYNAVPRLLGKQCPYIAPISDYPTNAWERWNDSDDFKITFVNLEGRLIDLSITTGVYVPTDGKVAIAFALDSVTVPWEFTAYATCYNNVQAMGITCRCVGVVEEGFHYFIPLQKADIAGNSRIDLFSTAGESRATILGRILS